MKALKSVAVASLFVLTPLATLATLGSAHASIASGASAGSVVSFPTTPAENARLRKNVDFWVSIYSQYDTTQGVIHDAKYIDHVYEVIKVRPGAVKESKRHWTNVLLSLHQKNKAILKGEKVSMTPDERRIYDKFADIDEPDKFLEAAHRKRLRFQLGQKDRFIEGLRYSGRYLPLMEETFRKAGMPVELTRLPFVESGFNIHARSKVGASGIWQFMRSTGKLFLEVDEAVDERNDPVRATEAATKLLKLNYDSLKNWGLAVTAYNHGRKGMMRAVRMVGSDQIEDLVDRYRSRSFGFASSNFFTCLLAAIEVERNSYKYFGQIERDPPLRFYEVRIPDYISLPKLTKFMHLELKTMKELNPAISEAVLRGELRLPKGYRLRLPRTTPDGKMPVGAEERIFLAGYSEIPGIYKFQTQR
ncbi:MAG: lytic transglycosylase domain-containing protein [Bdellovibrionia bacterium]